MPSCPFCGKEFEGNPSVCPHCGQVISGESGNEIAPPPPPNPAVQMASGGKHTRKTVPFEDPKFGFFPGMFETIKLALFHPSSFFSDYHFEGSIGRPMVFALVVVWFSTAVALVWNLIFNASIMSVLGKYMPSNEQMLMSRFGSQMMLGSIGAVVSLIAAPLLIVVGLFMMAGIYHLFLMMVSGAKRGFETTFNVTCYAVTGKLFVIIPFCGGTISMIYSLVLSIIGLSAAHETEGWKGAFAVLMPFLLCCCFILLMVLFFGAAIVGLAAQH